MKRYPKDPIRVAADQAKIEAETQVSDVDLVDLYEKTKLILQREIQNLTRMSIEGKLKSRESEALVSYTNLLAKLMKEEEKQANEGK